MVVQEPDRRAELTTKQKNELQKELAGMAAAAGGQKMAGVHYQMGFG